MEIRYVQRDPVTQEVTGHFANEQSYAKEALPADHPDILKYIEKRQAYMKELTDRKAERDPDKLLAEIRRLAKEIEDLKKSK